MSSARPSVFSLDPSNNLSLGKELNLKLDFNSLPSDKIFAVPKVKLFADTKLNVANMMIPVFVGIENFMGKGENAFYQIFPPPTMFSKGFFHRVVKSRDCVVKG